MLLMRYRFLLWTASYLTLLTAAMAAEGRDAAYNVSEVGSGTGSANTFARYVSQQDGSFVKKFYSYTINNDKNYEEKISDNTRSVSGDGSVKDVVAGLGLNNTGNIGSVTNKLFLNNAYDYTYVYPGGVQDVSVYVSGGAVYNSGVIGDSIMTLGTALTADFIGNSINSDVDSIGGVRVQGAAVANLGGIGNIAGDFVNNSVSGRYAEGGAVYNGASAIIGKMDSDFVGNVGEGESAKGGGLFNLGKIEGVNGNFIDNKVTGETQANGGAVHNNDAGNIRELSGEYIANIADGEIQAFGGAIDNLSGTIGNIKGVFNNNQVVSDTETRYSGAFGGAISNQGTIDAIEGDFLFNQSKAQVNAQGGAVYNVLGTIDNLSGKFEHNTAEATKNGAAGGAIYNEEASIGRVEGIFTNNQAVAGSAVAADSGQDFKGQGGAIWNSGTIGLIKGDFVDNEASSNAIAQGGAIYNEKSDTNTLLSIVNSNFYRNKAINGEYGHGGAIYSSGNVRISADGANSVFSENTAKDAKDGFDEAVYMADGAELSLEAKNKGNVVFEDSINGDKYTLNIIGDGSGEVYLGADADGIKDLNLKRNSRLHLGAESVISVENYVAENGNGAAPVVTLDVNEVVNDGSRGLQNGVFQVSGDVRGTTDVIVNKLHTDSGFDIDEEGVYSPFVVANKDNLETDASFTVRRVYGSAYMYDAIRNYKGTEEGSVWYLKLKENDGSSENSGLEVVPEIPAYVGMPTAAIEQTRGIRNKISNGLRVTQNRGCCDRRFQNRQALWLNADYGAAKIDSPSEMDVTMKGLTAGLTLVEKRDMRSGVFFSYGHGDYDLSGKGHFAARSGSKLDADSYQAGLYAQGNRGKWNLMGTVFGSYIDMEAKADDGFAKASTNAWQGGISGDVSYKFYLPHAWIVEPTGGVLYLASQFDKFHDNVGKEVTFDEWLHYFELELGLRIEHLFCMPGGTSKVYVKPSVIQTFAYGDEGRISGFREDKFSTHKNQLLGRIEIGTKFNINEALAAYTSADYTIGSAYEAYGVNLGLNYAW